MGAFTNISDRDGDRHWPIHAFRSLIALLALAIAAVAAAASSDDEPATRAIAQEFSVTDETEAPVSTSPLSLYKRDLVSEPNPARSGADVTPVTRAASQQRVDDMSPVGWLASFGSVTIGHIR